MYRFIILVFGLLAACGEPTPAATDQAMDSSTLSRLPAIPTFSPGQKSSRPDESLARIGRCHMDSCSWSIELSRKTVQQRDGDRLVRLTLLGGTSEHSGGEYPTLPGDAKIAWNKTPHELYVLCSRRLPAVIMVYDGQFQTDVFDFVNGPPGAQESAAEIYVDTCHKGQSWTNPTFARRNGYQALDEIPEISLKRPEEVFEYIPM